MILTERGSKAKHTGFAHDCRKAKRRSRVKARLLSGSDRVGVRKQPTASGMRPYDFDYAPPTRSRALPFICRHRPA